MELGHGPVDVGFAVIGLITMTRKSSSQLHHVDRSQLV
jgi:hypothetical protein